MSFNGSFALEINSTGAVVNEVITLADGDVLLALPVGPSGSTTIVRFAGTGITLDALGQQLSGDVVVESSAGTVHVVVANASLSLAGGVVTVTGASADLTVSPGGARGTFSGTVAFAVRGLSSTVQMRAGNRACPRLCAVPACSAAGATRYVVGAGGNQRAGRVTALSEKFPARLCGDQGWRDTPMEYQPGRGAHQSLKDVEAPDVWPGTPRSAPPALPARAPRAAGPAREAGPGWRPKCTGTGPHSGRVGSRSQRCRGVLAGLRASPSSVEACALAVPSRSTVCTCRRLSLARSTRPPGRDVHGLYLLLLFQLSPKVAKNTISTYFGM